MVSAQTSLLYLQVRDATSHRTIENVTIHILDPDSTIVDTCKMVKIKKPTGISNAYVSKFENRHPYYFIKVQKEGYDTEMVRVESSAEIRIEPILLHKTAHQLSEAVVRASKIMMVMHGDTIVYNADAFELSEGSMLEALIDKLPGVKLQSGGIITINGNPVSRLLIDGKDFFKGNPTVALENLPAYTVSKVKAYQKAPDDAYLTRHKSESNINDPWVVDVNLKKEYHEGWLVNVEVGAGTHKRYLEKGFGLFFNDRFRLGAYSNINNLNDNRKARQDGSWENGNSIDGRKEQLRGGLFFLSSSRDEKAQINTTVEAFRENENLTTLSASESFLRSGNIYNRSQTASRTCNRGFQWEGNLTLMKNKSFWNYQHYLNYSLGNTYSTILNATLSQKPIEQYRGAALDSIFTISGYSRFPYVTNYFSDYQYKKIHRWNYAGVLHFTINLPWEKSLSLIAAATYNKLNDKTYSNYLLRTPSVSTETVFYNRFISAPENSFSFNLVTDYCLFEINSKWNKTLYLGYEGKYENNKRNRLHYRLDRLRNGWNEQGSHLFGTLPSTIDSLISATDLTNSYRRKNRHWHHTPTVRFVVFGDETEVYLHLPLTIENAQIDEIRSECLRMNKSFFKFKPLIDVRHKNIRFYAKCSRNIPDLHLFLNVIDNSNPLATFLGNPNLLPTDVYNLKGMWQFQKKEYAQNGHLSIEYYIEKNSVGQSRSYDAATGSYTYKPHNINGNWQVELRGGYARNFDKNNHWSFSADGKVHYNHSVDFEWMNKTDVLQKSIVNNYQTEATLSLRYRSKPLNAGLKTVFDWQHATSRRANFQTINSFNILYALSLQAKLPWDIDVNSDFTLYTRNGYEDETMNTNEWVWNMSVEKRLLRNKSLTLKFTGFDILAQRSNIQRTLNAQGRTETWYNTLPRYCLFSLVWHFHRAPKQ